MAGALGTKVIGLMRNTDYLSAHFTPDHDMSDPGSGNADVTFGTWRCDGRVREGLAFAVSISKCTP